MITPEQLKEAQKKFEKASEPLHKKIAEAKEDITNLSKAFLNMLEKYYDEQLLDINNKSVKVGYVIEKNGRKYTVVDRGMQFVFNEMFFNPRVICEKVDGFTLKKRKVDIHPSDLKTFEICH